MNHIVQIAGKIRPGEKRLTPTAERNPEAVEMFSQLLAKDFTYDEIDAALLKAFKFIAQNGNPVRSVLMPGNTDHFRVSPDDFVNPANAKKIIELYAVDGVLKQFPVVFPFAEIEKNVPEGFFHYKTSELVHWSENGQCMIRQNFGPNPKNQRGGVRQHGGRPIVALRPCNPNACDEFGKGECKEYRSLRFYVPGVMGASLIELAHTSFYAHQGILQTLNMVHTMLGKVNGTKDGKPIFWISKVNQDVARIDWETRKPVRSKQWITTLEARDLDMCGMFAQAEMGGSRALPAPPVPAAIEHRLYPKPPFEFDEFEFDRAELKEMMNAKGVSWASINEKMSSDVGPEWFESLGGVNDALDWLDGIGQEGGAA